MGNIVPHLYTSCDGGAKILQQEACSEVTTVANHTIGVMKDHILYVCTNSENIVRKETEYIAAVVGLDFIVNTILEENKGIINIFNGHFIKAHLAGIRFAEQVFCPKIPKLVDILITTVYPS